jgi:hypothetical protein
VLQNGPRADAERELSDFSIHVFAYYGNVSTMTDKSSNTHTFQFLANNVGGDTDGSFDDLKTTQDVAVSIWEVIREYRKDKEGTRTGKGLSLLKYDAVCKCVCILTNLILKSEYSVSGSGVGEVDTRRRTLLQNVGERERSACSMS